MFLKNWRTLIALLAFVFTATVLSSCEYLKIPTNEKAFPVGCFPIASSPGVIAPKLLLDDGSLWVWGWVDSWRKNLFFGSTVTWEYKFTPVLFLKDITTVSSGSPHTLAVRSDGVLLAWGSNTYGQVGDGTTLIRTTPVQVLDGVTHVYTGMRHSLAITSDGTLWAWGYNGRGQVGDGTWTDQPTPVRIMEDVIAAAAGHIHSFAITSDGTLWAWGSNEDLRLGHKTIGRLFLSPVKILNNVASISAGENHSLAITSDGALLAWGDNSSGQLGVGTTITQHAPVRIMDDVAVALAANHFSFAITSDGALWAWGDNSNGQLGDGTRTDRYEPVHVLDRVVSISVNMHSVHAISSDGAFWVWGYHTPGFYGQPYTSGSQSAQSTLYINNAPMKIIDSYGFIPESAPLYGVWRRPRSARNTEPAEQSSESRIIEYAFMYDGYMVIKSDGSTTTQEKYSWSVMRDGRLRIGDEVFDILLTRSDEVSGGDMTLTIYRGKEASTFTYTRPVQ